MNNSIAQEIKYSFKHGNMLTRFILINISVFLLVNLIGLFFFLFSVEPANRFSLVEWLAIPADWKRLIFHPWTLISYMFLHEGFFHLLSNLIMLYFGGKLFIEYLGESRFTATYFLGGISGAILFVVVFNLFPAFKSIAPVTVALGASASVLAVFVAIATYLPNYSVNLLLIGPVRLKFIALFLVLLDLISIDKGNSGGHIAHLGGALYGYFAMVQLRKGRDISQGFQLFFGKLQSIFRFKPKSHLYVKHKVSRNDADYNAKKKSKQERIDLILDKISHSGYDSLSKEEKQELFNMSKE